MTIAAAPDHGVLSMYMADQILLNQWILQRDAQAFKTLTSKYCGMVYGTCVRILRNAADAEDVTQECFAALATIKNGPQGSMGAWLHRVATHQALNHRRSDQRRRNREERFSRSRPTSTQVQWDDVSQYVDEAIEELPEKVRLAIVAHFMEDQTVTAIAARECVTHSAISHRIQQGVILIRQNLSRRGISISAAVLAAMFTENAFAVSLKGTALPRTLGKIALSGGTVAVTSGTVWRSVGMKGIAALSVAVVGVVGALTLLSGAEPQSVSAAHADEEVAPAPEATSAAIDASGAEALARSLSGTTPEAPIDVAVAVENTSEAAIGDWRDVVRAYEEHQKHIRCITVEYEHSMKGNQFHKGFEDVAGYRETYERGTLTTDGERCYMEHYQWGSFFGVEVPADRPRFDAGAWNGVDYIQYDTGGGPNYGIPGVLQFHPNALSSVVRDTAFRNGRCYLLYARNPGGAMLGHLTDSGLRLEEHLRDARHIALRSKTEYVGGAECYVIDAETDYGNFTVWFDPAHAFNVAQYTVQQYAGNLYGGGYVPEGIRNDWVYTALRFAEVDGLWVPKESTLRRSTAQADGQGSDYIHHHVRTSIVLNSDCSDDTPYALDAEYIRNGALWMDTTGALGGAQFVWYNGEIVPKSANHAYGAYPKREGKGGYGGLIAGGISRK